MVIIPSPGAVTVAETVVHFGRIQSCCQNAPSIGFALEDRGRWGEVVLYALQGYPKVTLTLFVFFHLLILTFY